MRNHGTPAIRHRNGTTLVELLIVVIIISLIVAAAVPLFSNASEDSRLVALETDRVRLSDAVERYHHQHGHYPGSRSPLDGGQVSNVAQAGIAFAEQLTRFSNAAGASSRTRSVEYRFGPYVVTVPRNPFNDQSGVQCDITETDISKAVPTPAAGTGWKFYVKTGRLIPNHEGAESILDDAGRTVFELTRASP
jgi:prepilin-type N-terminal cleavage/methylation domain-containing protein